jgi:ferredoxin
MTHTVTEACIRCKYTDCVDVCPVDCFREGPNFLVIDPDECIDCAVCIPECPVNAIYAEEDVPADQRTSSSSTPSWPSCRAGKASPSARPPLPDADDWKDKTNKLRADPLKESWNLNSTNK